LKLSGLRDAIEKIVNGGAGSLADHPEAIAAVSPRFPHSIQLVPDSADQPYNCFMLALGLLDSDRVYEILAKDADWYGLAGITLGPELVSRAIEGGVLAKDPAGDVLIYFRGSLPVHAGIINAGRVRSKWGIGHLWEHAQWEVPSSYGDTAERYTIVHPEALESMFEEYAAELIAAKGGYPG
jgi:hypothetical protein